MVCCVQWCDRPSTCCMCEKTTKNRTWSVGPRYEFLQVNIIRPNINSYIKDKSSLVLLLTYKNQLTASNVNLKNNMHNTKQNNPGGMHHCCATPFGDAGGGGGAFGSWSPRASNAWVMVAEALYGMSDCR